MKGINTMASAELYAVDNAQNGHYGLKGVLDFETVSHVLKQVSALFGQNNKISIDLHEVSKSNSAGLGLLLECMQQASQAGCRVEFRNIPQQLLAIARASDVDVLLPVVEEPH